MIDHTDLETIVNLVVSIRPRPALVTRAQAAEMLGLSEPTVRKLIRLKKIMLSEDGKIPPRKTDRHNRARIDDQGPGGTRVLPR